jgi:ornithine decarboxylase antizyme 1
VPHTANVSAHVSAGDTCSPSGVGKPKLASSSVADLNLTKQSIQEPIRLSFAFNNNSTEHSDVHWDAILWHENLYLQVPNGVFLERSKEAFVSLLEFAEEELSCSHIIVCFNKNRNERNTLMRMFMFFGFVALPPNHALSPADASEDVLYMAYNVG